MYEDLSDDEIVDSIYEHFEEDGRVKTDFIEIECHDGKVMMNGRVASDEESQIAQEIIADILSITDIENHLWVDDTLVFENIVEAPEVAEVSENDKEYDGTEDPVEASQSGLSYTPPDKPLPEEE